MNLKNSTHNCFFFLFSFSYFVSFLSMYTQLLFNNVSCTSHKISYENEINKTCQNKTCMFVHLDKNRNKPKNIFSQNYCFKLTKNILSIFFDNSSHFLGAKIFHSRKFLGMFCVVWIFLIMITNTWCRFIGYPLQLV